MIFDIMTPPIIYIFGGLLLFAIIVLIALFNKIIRADHMVKEAWSGIDVQLKRRHELIPSLLETVKGITQHEQSTLEQVTQARSESLRVKELGETESAETALSGALRGLLAIAESYPDLKASENFIQFQKHLVETENRIEMARRYYNGSVRDFNILIESFPGILLANTLNKTPKDFFEIEFAYEKDAPEVQL